MNSIKISPSYLNGEVTVPPSKSVAHRALICGALSGNIIKFNNIYFSDDIEATINALKSLGIEFETFNNSVLMNSKKLKRNSDITIDAYESGSTLRFLIPVCIALNNKTEFLGSGRLPQRPLDTYFEIFKKEGIDYKTEENKYLPLTVSGAFNNNNFFVDGNISSQFITGLILSAIITDEKKVVYITTELESKPYIEITADILNKFGHSVTFNENIIEIKKGKCNVKEFEIENDWSQAAFFLCAGAINGDVTVKGMDLNSKQGDKKIIEILKEFGADIEINKDIRVKKSNLKAIDIDAKDIPDLVPILSVLACKANGTTRIYNAKRLRIKESDRLHSMYTELKKLGADIKEGEDYLEITGVDRLKGNIVKSHNDHRIAMSLAIASLYSDKDIVINDFKAVNKSYPDFLSDFSKLGGIYNEQY